jgi:mRNA-degrading endonuclease RelE of RelBE toxin-antitoxin system
MEFKEFPGFSDLLGNYLSDDRFQELQSELIGQPEKGDLIKETGGARKIRVAAKGKGKRGGVRVIYYFQVAHTIHLLAIYPKNEKSDLSPKEKKLIADLVQAIKEGVL